MTRTNLRALVAAMLVLIATPILAQGFSSGFTFLKAVRERNGAKAMELLNTPGTTVANSRDPETGDGPLHILVRGRDASWLGFLLQRGSRADGQNNDGATPLLLAAQIGWIEGAERLLMARANPNLGNRRGETPLILATQRYDVAMVRLLMSRGADPNQTDSIAGNSAIDYARQDRRGQAVLRELERPAAARPAQPQVQGPPAPRPPGQP